MSQDMEGLVETSSNLASIHHTDGQVVVATSQRSSIGSARENMSQVVAAALQLGGAKTDIGEGYPGWKMNPNSVILKVATDSYRRLFGKEPLILAIHAGLECGLFSEKYPGLDMISVGPTLRGVHSPEERLHIPSVDLVWQHLLDILKHIPA
jgi:dipeptidase D